jgi:hypothetical protein
MLVTCWSVKGGSGTTVVAATLALIAAERRGSTWLVDLAGDSPAALGAPEPAGPGIGDWLGAPPSVAGDAIARLAVPISPGLSLLPWGGGRRCAPERWTQFTETLVARGETTVVDAGTGPPPDPLRAASQHDVLVVRPCYLALRRVAALATPPRAIVLVEEPGRALRRHDVEHAAGAPVVAEVPWDPCVARAVDAGLLAGRLPRSVRGALSGWGWLT